MNMDDQPAYLEKAPDSRDEEWNSEENRDVRREKVH